MSTSKTSKINADKIQPFTPPYDLADSSGDVASILLLVFGLLSTVYKSKTLAWSCVLMLANTFTKMQNTDKSRQQTMTNFSFVFMVLMMTYSNVLLFSGHFGSKAEQAN
eukprot:Clim_evm84s88 gene=Clim_evmTU84s88